MPEFKNQHFVPRAHLKPFSVGGKGKAINLVLVETGRTITNAPVKGQCSRDYFYGQDNELESALGQLEGAYSKCVQKISSRQKLEPDDIAVLRVFWAIQYHRTESAVRRHLEGTLEMEELAFRGTGHNPPAQEDAQTIARGGILSAMEAVKILQDLNFAVVQNATEQDFFTSDDPAVLTNKIFIQKYGVIEGFGMMTSGTIALLPVTPRAAIIFYDPQAYSLGSRLVQSQKAMAAARLTAERKFLASLS